MARGFKKTSKQRRQTSQIEESAEKRGMSPKRAKQIAFATVNKQAAAMKGTSARGKKRSTASSRKGGRRTGR